MARTFERVFEEIRTKGVLSFRQFFDENTETEWRRLISKYGKEIAQNADYSVDNFVGDVVQALSDYLNSVCYGMSCMCLVILRHLNHH